MQDLCEQAQRDAEAYAKLASTEVDWRVDEAAQALNSAQADASNFMGEVQKDVEARTDEAVDAGARVLDNLQDSAGSAAKEVMPVVSNPLV
jgi:hypothetical protein